MATIKVNTETLGSAAEKASDKVENYQTQVINASAIFGSMIGELDGRGYEALISQIEKAMGNQKNLVAECALMIADIKNYGKEMAEAENSVSFPT